MILQSLKELLNGMKEISWVASWQGEEEEEEDQEEGEERRRRRNLTTNGFRNHLSL